MLDGFWSLPSSAAWAKADNPPVAMVRGERVGLRRISVIAGCQTLSADSAVGLMSGR